MLSEKTNTFYGGIKYGSCDHYDRKLCAGSAAQRQAGAAGLLGQLVRPCRMLSPIVDEVAEERTDVKVGKVNVDEQPDLAAQFGVMSIPTLLVFEQCKLVRQAVGARPKAGVLELLG